MEWTDEAVKAAFSAYIDYPKDKWEALAAMRAALDAATSEQSRQLAIQRNKRLAERYSWIPPDEL